MNEEELQRLVVRLVGDAASYQKMLDDATRKTEEAASHVQKATEKVEHFAHGLETVGAAIGGVFAAVGISAGFEALLGRFEAAEKTMMHLEATIEATGQEVDKVVPHYKALAAEIANTSTVSKKAVFDLAKQAEVMGFHGKQADSLIKNAIAFAKAQDMDAESGFRAAMALEMGETQMLKFALGLRRIKDDSKVMETAQNLLTAGQKIMAREMETTEGKITLLKRAFASISVQAGALLAEGFIPVLNAVKSAADWFNALPAPVRQTTVQVAALSAGMIVLAETVGKLTMFKLGAALAAHPYLVVAAALAAVALAGNNVIREMTGMAEAEKGAAEAAERLAAVQDRALRNTLRRAGEIQKPAERKEFLAPAVADTEKQVHALEHTLEGLKEERPGVLNPRWWTESFGDAARARGEITEVEKQLKAARDRLHELTAAEKEAAAQGPVNPAVKKFMEDLNDELVKLNAGEREFQLMGLADQKATPKELEHAKARMRLRDETKWLKEAEKDLEKSLVDERTALILEGKEMDASHEAIARRLQIFDQAKAHTLTKDIEKQVEAIQMEIAATHMLPGAFAAMKAAQDGASEASQKLLEKWTDLKEANKIIEDIKTPWEKLQDETVKLDRLLQTGKLTQDQYALALNKVRQSLLGVASAQAGVQATAASSVEAKTRVDAYLMQFRAAPLTGAAEAKKEPAPVEKEQVDVLKQILRAIEGNAFKPNPRGPGQLDFAEANLAVS